MENNQFDGDFATITGWGKTSDAAPGAPDTVHYAYDRPIISNPDCQEGLNSVGAVQDNMVCIDTSDRTGVCNGDSGGPLNLQVGGEEATGPGAQYVQIGVANYVPNEGCESGKPHVFARVTSYLNWIQDTTGIDIN